MADRKWLSTGQAAKLCSVTPDTVQKWIRSRRLAAQRTAGGHYRIDARDIGPFSTSPRSQRWYPAPPRQCAPQPLRCWEYLSDSGEVSSQCQSCVVYRVRAAWCFEVLGTNGGAGHARTYCNAQGGCADCIYYKRVCGRATNILVITADHRLRTALESETCDSVAVHFAQDGYEVSTAITSVRPEFVVVDARGPGALDETLVRHLLDDTRMPGLRVVVYGRTSGTIHALRARVLTITKRSIHLSDLVDLVASIPVEHKSDAPSGNSRL